MQWKIKFVVAIGLLITISLKPIFAIEGWVFENSNNKQALIGVNVFWAGTNTGTTSDHNGYFKLNSVKSTTILVFSYVGYSTDSVNTQNKSQLKVYLSAGEDISEITVSERTQSASISKLNPILTQNISSKELTKFACCNLSESFETNASVDVAYADAVSGIKQIRMLGLSGRYTQIMLENIPILRGVETAFGLDYIPGTWMESIQVSKGSAAVKNGYESITGQINISFKDPDKNEKIHYYFYGNQDGKLESNAGLSLRANENWTTNLLVHTASNTRKLDMNNDGFIDKPRSYTGTIMNRWNFKGKKVEAKLGISYLQENRLGGQTSYNHSIPQQEQSAYGIEIDVKRVHAFSKIGFLLNRPNTSIGWISSANYFTRASFYGFNSFNADQKNLYTNLMFQSYMFNTKHTYTTGVTLNYDINNEYFSQINTSEQNLGFNEFVPGSFFEYNYIPSDKFSVLMGLRADYSSLHGLFATPRLHAKYKISKHSTLRSSVGKGYRSALTISENTPLLASSKVFNISNNKIQEEAWNYGLSIYNEFDILKKKANVTLEFFRTQFINQLVVDLEQNNNQIYFYNLNGESYANSYQIELFYELFKRFEITSGLRLNNAYTNYNGKLKQVPFQSSYKGLLSAQYRTNMDKWQFDATIQFHGEQRLPNNITNNNRYSESYTNVIAQVTKNYRYWSFYVGSENLGNFTQKNAIIAPESPFDSNFNASEIWGPVYGRMFYVGVKYILDKRF